MVKLIVKQLMTFFVSTARKLDQIFFDIFKNIYTLIVSIIERTALQLIRVWSYRKRGYAG